MAKKKSSSSGKLMYLIAIVAGVASICMMFMSSMKINGSVFGLSGTTEYSGLKVVFGHATENVTYLEFSFMNLLPYLLVVGAVVLCALKLLGVVKAGFMDFIALGLFVAGAVLFFLTPNFAVLADSFANAFKLANAVKKDMVTKTLGIGAILSGAFSAVGAVVILVKGLKK